MLRRHRHEIKVKNVSVNPFLTIMYKSMTFKAWVKRYRKNEKLRKDEQECELEREDSQEEFISRQEEPYEYITEEDESVDSDEEDEEEGVIEEEEHSLKSDEEDDFTSSKGRSGISGSQPKEDIDSEGVKSSSPRIGAAFHKGFTIKLQKVQQLKEEEGAESPIIMVKS